MLGPPWYTPPHTHTHGAQKGGAVRTHSRVFINGQAGSQRASSTNSLCMYEFSQWRRSRAASIRARSRKAASSASARLRRDRGVAGPTQTRPGERRLRGDRDAVTMCPGRPPPPRHHLSSPWSNSKPCSCTVCGVALSLSLCLFFSVWVSVSQFTSFGAP